MGTPAYIRGYTQQVSKAVMVAITLLAFTRNRATNVLPLILGLFFKVSGTGSQVMTMLSNVGLCVSGRTVERLKKVISEAGNER